MQVKNLKAIAALALLSLSLGLNGCNESSRAQTKTQTQTPTTQPNVEEESQDKNLAKKLIGTWETRRIEDKLAYQLEESFYPSQQFSGTANVINSDGETAHVRYSGTWEIEDNYLNYKITSSSRTDLLPIGDVSANKIVNITDKDYVYIDPHGNQQVDRRLN